MKKILAKELKIKFIETLNEIDNFSYEEGNPFLIKIKTQRFYVFLKNISPAYFKNSPDITRVQLPYSNHFLKIFKAKIPFIILGYDADNDIFVSWNPKKIKERLNAKSNVSLYSRESFQAKALSKEFEAGYLSNGEKIIIFRRQSLKKYFENMTSLFKCDEELVEKNITIINEPILNLNSKHLNEITDSELIKLIRPLLKKNKVLEAVENCSNYYNGKYQSMTFKDWFKVVNLYYKKIQAEN